MTTYSGTEVIGDEFRIDAKNELLKLAEQKKKNWIGFRRTH
jgi:hypothetical protein